MKRLDSFLLKVFFCGLPVLVVYAIFTHSYNLETSAQAGGYIQALYDFGGFVFGSWMILAVYLSVRLMASGLFREKVLTKFTFIKERDEREVLLTGKAAKTTMLTSIAILIFLFCFSCFQVSIYRVPPEQAVDGKTGIVSLGLGFDLLNSSSEKKMDEDIQKKNIVSYTGLPISTSTVILGLIIWQIIAYNYSMRRFLK
ncbi:hypothetical protein SPSIL_013390 [Sporomusa silvacetica DSM 10669]|uniref:Uncharacterized protein n=1 Tax=Sporomusa silvacetica DSM 10669 TaxID=1123289 RepID=A0ABZ3IHT1_9FIRM|nr:hypothetical protein [Sporomusa silvacetica]OZC16787.1 hypothetical protein SPSIL_36240 [Sporomusa silvacetica DSM 10669]